MLLPPPMLLSRGKQASKQAGKQARPLRMRSGAAAAAQRILHKAPTLLLSLSCLPTHLVLLEAAAFTW